MFYRGMEEDLSMDFENSSIMDTEETERAICPYSFTECPYKQDQEQEFDPTLVRQRRRRRRRPYYYSRPYQYPYFPLYYLLYNQPYYPWDYDEYSINYIKGAVSK